MSDKGKVTDSGVGLSRKSRSSGSFGRADRSSFNDFDDDSGQGSRRGTFDDDFDDDYVDPEDVKVDLSAYLDQVPAGDDVGDEDEEAEDEDEEEGSEDGEGDNEEEDDEGQYETEEEEAAPAAKVLPKTSDELLEEQREQQMKALKAKKRALINEYLHDVKHFNHIKIKNILLGLKIQAHTDKTQAVVEKYMQRELEEQERLNAERLKKCGANKRSKKKVKEPRKRSKQKKSKKKKMRFQFSLDEKVPPVASPSSSAEVLYKRKFKIEPDDTGIPNVSLNVLGKQFSYNLMPVQERRLTISDSAVNSACKRNQYLKERIGRKLKKFSFMRSLFYNDALKPKVKKRHVQLMDLDINQLRSKSSRFLERQYGVNPVEPEPTQSSLKLRKPKSTATAIPSATAYFGLQKGKWKPTKEALALARSKSRMALNHRKQEAKIRLRSTNKDYKNLHHFKFEFAEPHVTSKQMSVKLRDELIKMLSNRHIPTSQLRWTMEVKDIDQEGKNPFGRVILNYSRLSDNARELPHTAYRTLLTNLSYLRMKNQRMNQKHRKNMIELEEERSRLIVGLRQIFSEIIDGLRIFASLCGITDNERKEARHEFEGFAHELEKFFTECLMDMLVNLYKEISSCEFALRKLWVSEGKGEGGELHEFKEIIRCREKLKVEHKNIEQSIMQYQRHTNKVFKNVRHVGRRLQEEKDSVIKINSELSRMKKALDIMIEGMYICQHTARAQKNLEVQFKSDMGISSYPVLIYDYENTLKQIEDTKSHRMDLQRKYNSKVRDIEKILPPPSRYARYKLRS